MSEPNTTGRGNHDRIEDIIVDAVGLAALKQALAAGSTPEVAFAATEAPMRAAAKELALSSAQMDQAWREANKIFKNARAAGRSPTSAFETAMKIASVSAGFNPPPAEDFANV